jgi:hypothetical protein
MTRLSSSKKSKSRMSYRPSFPTPFPPHWSMAAPTVTLRLGTVGSYTSRSTQTYGKSKHVFSASRKSERSLRSVPPPPRGSYAATYCAQEIEPYITLYFVITSLTLETCLPGCVPHSVRESRMKRALRALEDQSLTGATCSEAGILPPARSHWRREQIYFGTDLPNP